MAWTPGSGILEGRLRDLASEPPPIPSGRRPGRLDDLRAVLRAQAPDEAEADDDGSGDSGRSPEEVGRP